jgi:DNA-binding NtrC family response regulator
MKTGAQPGTSVVLVMASCDPALDDIQKQLDRLDVAVQPVVNLQEFQQLLRPEQAPEVVITGVSLPDGNWCDVLASTVRAGSPARVLVCSRDVDERFWSEAIWRGVHDILVAPFTAEYLQRSVEFRDQCGRGGQTDESRSRLARRERRDTYNLDDMPVLLTTLA